MEKGETLQAPIYGVLFRNRNCDFGYLGLTDAALLIPSGKAIGRNDFIDSIKDYVYSNTDPFFEWECTDSTRGFVGIHLKFMQKRKYMSIRL